MIHSFFVILSQSEVHLIVMVLALGRNSLADHGTPHDSFNPSGTLLSYDSFSASGTFRLHDSLASNGTLF